MTLSPKERAYPIMNRNNRSVELKIRNGKLNVQLTGWAKILCWRGSFSIPLEHIVEAHVEGNALMWRNLASTGTMIPGMFKVGTYATARGAVLWYVTRNEPFLSITLRSGPYHRISVTTGQEEKLADHINSAIKEVDVLISSESSARGK